MKTFPNLPPDGLLRARTDGSCVSPAGGLAARQDDANGSQKDGRAEDVGRPGSAVGGGRPVGGSRPLDSRDERDVGIHPDATRDRGQVPVVPRDRRLAWRGQAAAARRRVRGGHHGRHLIRRLATTSPTRPHDAASSYGPTVLPTAPATRRGPPVRAGWMLLAGRGNCVLAGGGRR